MAGPNREGDSPELDDDAVAARWAELTASLGELTVPPAPAPEDPAGGPASPGGPHPPRDPAVPDTVDRSDGASGARSDGAPGGLPGPPASYDPPPARVVRPAAPGPRDYVPEEDEDDGYDPPEPEPLTHADPVVTLGWIATVGAVVLGVVLTVVWHPVPEWVLGSLALVLAGGVGLLLWRMPARRDHDDHSDGAVV